MECMCILLIRLHLTCGSTSGLPLSPCLSSPLSQGQRQRAAALGSILCAGSCPRT